VRAIPAGLCIALLAAACAPAASPGDRCDPAAFRAVAATRPGRSEVTLCGTVVSVSRIRRSRSGAHRVFVVDVGGNDRVQVDANVDIMGNFPIRTGEYAVVRGEYYYDAPSREGVHWTHRTDRGNHPAGFVTLDGVTYR
jgi:hypothetical protein